MPRFEVKQIQVPLFGVVDAPDKAAWLAAFAAGTTTIPIDVDDVALDMLAEDLELDAQGLAADAERYVRGNYRAKARGIGGSRLGDLGEVLTYLVKRASGQNIVRVVSWQAGAGQAVKGGRFPQPDFIFPGPSGLAALEVKSTQAFDFIDLRDEPKQWTFLRPCSSVAGCRKQALPQLGFVEETLTPQAHLLEMQGGRVVPFPVGQGVAVAVIAIDGRTNMLRSESRFRTPPGCRKASRNCWSCLPETCHFVIVTMPNAPGMLSLGGADDGDSSNWLRAYQRWSQALAARDPFAVKSSLGFLTESIVSWLPKADGKAEVLRSFWGSYLHDAMRSRGLDVEVPGQLGDLSRPGFEFEWTPSPLAEPATRDTSIQDIANFISRDQQSVVPFAMSARLGQDDRLGDSITVRGFGEFVEFHLVSDTWWTRGSVETIATASEIATRLLSVVLNASDWPRLAIDGAIPLRELVARVGEHSIRLGWEPKAGTPRSEAWREWMRHGFVWFDMGPWPPWPALLASGDPRVRLRVTPDGRASLRMPRVLLRRR